MNGMEWGEGWNKKGPQLPYSVSPQFPLPPVWSLRITIAPSCSATENWPFTLFSLLPLVHQWSSPFPLCLHILLTLAYSCIMKLVIARCSKIMVTVMASHPTPQDSDHTSSCTVTTIPQPQIISLWKRVPCIRMHYVTKSNQLWLLDDIQLQATHTASFAMCL
jgi:hypothetical protein